ncbi:MULTISPECIES: substrate-binding domain-containing protein [Bradyrhizobium]|uniref:Periplasmic binding protein domain-containing protein n=3 Tax=Bradyrhizobium TaxID=374 RepID=A0AAE6CCF5_9BRAD|nr:MULTISPECIES: substrate-binding domain-containing protein [Bradyrhizobium]MCG2631948.1 substrate-binding domain-containing protein [Bradyrhizobium zhengyangense]MCG2645003.1 substrate-binding domain-containing protein [Bradyrhizobium zhengyangense]MCG2672741.1 substrate-binding domain-containing protein [Bradyrhizobium zhengyangense]MDN4985408.1 substrate-binding domain-containing protein [Bradyrhizobium sp. WYCCWR 13022]MDN5002361.1 substrate-binding domain-containing protein [Bradyrhizobi
MIVARIVRRAFLAGVAGIALTSVAFADGPTPIRVKSDAHAEVPQKFKNHAVKIAVVRQLNTGDVYQEWIAGVEAEAKKLGVKLTVYNADGDNAKQALMLQQAVATQPDAIVIGWGFGDSLRDGIKAAADANIPVVTYYVSVEPSDKVITVDQGDKLMMTGILGALKAHIGGDGAKADVIYVYVPGYQALDLRNEVWKEFLRANPGVNTVATIGVVNANTAAQTADQAKAALTAHPNVKAIVAPYDEFTKGASLAISELGLADKVKTYGMDISTADIAVMTKPHSPWVVTATTNQSNVGSVVLRVAAARIAGDLIGNTLSVPPLVITQEELRTNKVENIEQLGAVFPDLKTPDVAKAPWMDKMK